MKTYLLHFSLCVLFVSLNISNVFALKIHHETSCHSPLLGIVELKRPNPADSTFSVKLSTSQNLAKEQATLILNSGMYKELKYIKLYDFIGKNILFQPIYFKSGIATYKINMANLKPGIYFCRVYSSKGLVETRKLIHF